MTRLVLLPRKLSEAAEEDSVAQELPCERGAEAEVSMNPTMRRALPVARLLDEEGVILDREASDAQSHPPTVAVVAPPPPSINASASSFSFSFTAPLTPLPLFPDPTSMTLTTLVLAFSFR